MSPFSIFCSRFSRNSCRTPRFGHPLFGPWTPAKLTQILRLWTHSITNPLLTRRFQRYDGLTSSIIVERAHAIIIALKCGFGLLRRQFGAVPVARARSASLSRSASLGRNSGQPAEQELAALAFRSAFRAAPACAPARSAGARPFGRPAASWIVRSASSTHGLAEQQRVALLEEVRPVALLLLRV